MVAADQQMLVYIWRKTKKNILFFVAYFTEHVNVLGHLILAALHY